MYYTKNCLIWMGIILQMPLQLVWAADFVEPPPNEIVARVAGTEFMARDFAPTPKKSNIKDRAAIMTEIRLIYIKNLSDAIWRGLRERIVIENKIQVTPAEVADYLKSIQKVKSTQKSKNAQISAMESIVLNSKAEAEILKWKADQYLYTKYKGQLALKDSQPIPVDAYVKYLKEIESQGDFEILRPDFKELFYAQYSAPNIKPIQSHDQKNPFESPPWLK